MNNNDNYLEENNSDLDTEDEDIDEESNLNSISIQSFNPYNSDIEIVDSSFINILDNSGINVLDNSSIEILDISGTPVLSFTPFLNRIMSSIDDTIESAVSREISFLEKPVYKTVITKEGEDRLKKVKFKDSEKRNISCPILFIDFEEEEEIIELECKHCFNQDAIKKWLKEEKAECPVCRCQLKDTKDEKVEIEKVSRDDIRNNMRREYVNFLSESIHTIYENETELQLQRLLMQEYTNNE